MTRPQELDVRGRRLRAALAAVLVADNAPEVRLREWARYAGGHRRRHDAKIGAAG